ncbi:MAG: 50S ribosomal protein L4 [Chloroflexi bacterium]|nr:50S ribosomal protein L4 [Chloroflexota bacterium]MDA1218021.1 50S ribosomal protein L4 [Chloroflexota bacterium]
MEVPVKNQNGETIDTIQLNDEVFNAPMNQSLVHQVVVIYQGNKRQGTHSTKTRAEVSGGGRKPWIQKHTGRARQGSTRSPQWRHGGVVFGPHPRDYRKLLPKQLRRQAVRCVLSEKARRGNLICVDSMDTLDGKTRSMVSLLKNLGISSSALVVTNGPDANLVLAAHNIKGIWTMPINLLNANDLLRRETLIMTVDAVRQAEEIWTGRVNRGPSHRPWANVVPQAPVEVAEAPAPRRRPRATTSTESEGAAE